MFRRLAALALVIVSAIALAGSPAPAAVARADTTTVRPGLPRGDDPRSPVVLGTQILDGELEVSVDVDEVQLLGMSGDDYVVAAYAHTRVASSAVLRVRPDGTTTTLLGRIRGDVLLSADGEELFATVLTRRGGVVTAYDTESGDRLAQRVFKGYAVVLDADAGRAVLGNEHKTWWWDATRDTTRRISRHSGYFADIGADRLGVVTDSVYDGGCSEVSALSRPAKTLWRSCADAISASSPNGRRYVTVSLFADGPTGQVDVRSRGGRVLDTYRGRRTLDTWTWESNRSVLLTVSNGRTTAIVRCLRDECERASRKLRSLP